MTADLVQFLRDRLDEDQRLANGATWAPESDWETLGNLDSGLARWIARHDPARVLAEVEAKREVVRLAERAHDYHETFMNGFAAAMEHALRLFALPYADHPEYRDEWRP